ncbi:Fas-binding factor 1 [Eumeta japonica]|uniref:Fas-binding factor 1 n=1 Tax=Eumeta variegata TaxID=151549 RepID=A0A4C1WSB6_EUMVA|nr:Fas-binding factor 1 [Eumeta japonica]
MSFNIDDPLADILSDGSDDSFFDDDILGKKKSTKKSNFNEKKVTTTSTDKKNSLFDLEDETKAKKTVGKDNFDKTEANTPIIPRSPFKHTQSKFSDSIQSSEINKPLTKQSLHKPETVKSPANTKSNNSVDKLNVVDDKSIDTNKEISIEKGKSSQSFLDDILGGPATKTGISSQASKPTTTEKDEEFDFNSILGTSDTKPTNPQINKKTQKGNAKSDNLIKEKGQPKKLKSSEDWLGVFQSTNETEESDNTGMPSWLLGTDTKKKKSEKVTTPKAIENETLHNPTETIVAQADINKNINKLEYPLSNNKILEQSSVHVPTTMFSSQDDVTTEGAALYLQQQESQLMVALQLKAQEEKLAALQMRQEESQRIQREISQARATQLNSLLQRQANQRAQMQAAIAEHQERINMRIKALLGSTDNEDINVEDGDTNYEHTKMHNESPGAKERQQLLALIQSLQENHNKEVELMESSYRRQLAFVEISLSQSEERMKEDTEKQMRYYTEKIEWLEEHHKSYKQITEESVKTLAQRHDVEARMLREQHMENIKALQEHHAALIENIKNAVKQEQTLITDSAGFSSSLHELVDEAKESRSICQSIATDVQHLTERMQKETDKTLQARETLIGEMLQQLKRERENFDIEKSENREMTKALEARLKQMTQFVEEESTSMKQKQLEFEFEKATFNKQTEFAKNVLKKQEEEIKMLKESIQKEYQDKISRIEEEKSKALKDSSLSAKERNTVHSLRQELEGMKAELKSQLDDLSEERSKLNMEKQQLHIEEQRILAKSRDMELLAKTAIEKQMTADKKYSEAEYVQKKYEERIRRIQEHAVSLNAREKQIAREKVALSRERLNLHNERRQMEGKQCSLCRPTRRPTGYGYDEGYVAPEYPSVSRDYGDVNVSAAMNAIESEMAHLLSRNIGLRNVLSGSLEAQLANSADVAQNRDIGVSLNPSAGVEVKKELCLPENEDLDDPKLSFLRVDVEQVISNLGQDVQPAFEQ